MSKRYPVFIDGKRYSGEFQIDPQYKKGWHSVLARAYEGRLTGELVRCGCPSALPRPLYISLRDGRYHLSRWPGQGGHHAIDCRFYSTVPEHSGMQCYEDGVIKEANGLLSVRLAHGLREHEGKDASPADQLKRILEGARDGKSQRAMSILGLLHLLWQEAAINIWHPNMAGRRYSTVVASRLRKAGSRIGSQRIRLSDILVLPAEKQSPEQRINETVVQAANEKKLRLVLVGALAKHTGVHPDAFPESPMFAKPFGYPRLYVGSPLRKALETQFARELKAWADGHRVIFIAHCEVKQAAKSGRVYARAVAGALMRVSPMWIPVDSGYELEVETLLREQHRFFEKPMRFDSHHETVFPDFWLLDRERRTPLEVFGMTTPAYLERKAAKIAHYQSHQPDNWWCWEPQVIETIPALPPIQRTQTRGAGATGRDATTDPEPGV